MIVYLQGACSNVMPTTGRVNFGRSPEGPGAIVRCDFANSDIAQIHRDGVRGTTGSVPAVIKAAVVYHRPRGAQRTVLAAVPHSGLPATRRVLQGPPNLASSAGQVPAGKATHQYGEFLVPLRKPVDKCVLFV